VQNVIPINRKEKLNWSTIIPLIIFHLLALSALFTFSWTNLAATLVLWWVSAGFGIGVGFHRLMTHRGFQTPRWVERLLAVCGSLALQGSPIAWVTTHRIHHAFTDQEKDPHSPRHGTYWAHMGWIIRGTSQLHSEASIKRYIPDVIKDPFMVKFSNWYWVPSVIVAAILFAIGGYTGGLFGGVSMVLWAIFFRIVGGWHATWLVNSATHLWGTRRFETTDDSTNNALIAAITFGEGWHNNHHAHPRSAKHGMAWYEIDLNWIQIWTLEKMGLAKKVFVYEIVKEEPAALSEAA
jgi:fatty-acid desaturase